MKALMLILAASLLTACGETSTPVEPKALASYWYANPNDLGYYDLDLATSGRATFYYYAGGNCACDAVVTETSLTTSNCVQTATTQCTFGSGLVTFAYTPGRIQMLMSNGATVNFE